MTINGQNIAQVAAMPVAEGLGWCKALALQSKDAALAEHGQRLPDRPTARPHPNRTSR
ncbi:MAG: hypothetical protein U0Z44_19860 [Kouleothrix sp.]